MFFVRLQRRLLPKRPGISVARKRLQDQQRNTKRIGRPPETVGCRVSDCNRKHLARGFCSKHYHEWNYDCKQAGHKIDPETWVPPKSDRRKNRAPKYTGCRVDDCDGKHRSKGFCDKHYKEWCKADRPDPETWVPKKRVKHTVCRLCGTKHLAKGFCSSHYYQWKGDCEKAGKTIDPETWDPTIRHLIDDLDQLD